MYHLPKLSTGKVLTAANWNDHVDAINDALNRASNFNAMVPSVPAPPHWGGGRYVHDAGGFSLRSLVKEGDKWMAYFNPGKVSEIHAGGARIIVPTINGHKMDKDPYPGLEAKVGKVYLDLTAGDNAHDCITTAKISTNAAPPGGRSCRIVIGEFVSDAGSSGSSIDDIAYKPYLTGCITHAHGSRNEGWRVLAVPNKDGQPAAAYLRRGNIYAFGRLVSEASGNWEAAPAKQGDIWITVKFDGDGNYKSFSIGTSPGEAKPLTADGLDENGNRQDSAVYCFKLATIKVASEPCPDDGNPASFVNVRQYIAGSVFCDLAKCKKREAAQEDGNEGFRVAVEKDTAGKVAKVKVRPGHVYFCGRFCTTALGDGTADWVDHSATSGEVWLVVNFDIWGRFESAALATEEPSTATLTPFVLSTEATGIKGQYAFHLATVKDDGTVKQYSIGAVYCLFDPATFFTPGPAE